MALYPSVHNAVTSGSACAMTFSFPFKTAAGLRQGLTHGTPPGSLR